MPPLSLDAAWATLLAELAALPPRASDPEEIPLDEAQGRVLAAPVRADRDQPPFPRVTRDGFAVRAADVNVAGASAGGVELEVIGEVPAGSVFAGIVRAGACVEIMTGAPLPAGADAVVMVEHTARPAPARVRVARPVAAGENVVPRGSELATGAIACPAGTTLGPAAIGLLASLGCVRPLVHRRPRVALLATGDEIVPADTARPEVAQIRNSNQHALAAQVRRAGGLPVACGIAADEPGALKRALEEAHAGADLLLVSGGVSMGKYDFVEGVLAELGARVVWDGVAIRPGKPVVFGLLGGKPFFGLPGNPLSTLVTFELFARPTLRALAGASPAPPPLLEARLAAAYEGRPLGLTAFLPALLTPAARPGGSPATVRLLASQGSGDLGSVGGADVFVVLPPGTERLAAGAAVSVLPV